MGRSLRRRVTVAIRVPLVALFTVSMAFAMATVAPAQTRGQLPKVQRALDRIVAAGAPGALVLVRDGGRTVQLTSGLGNLDPKTLIGATDRYRIGGLTKTFTATVVLQMVGEGTLSLDDTLESWLPGAISNGEDITLRQLLNHTSGIYDYANDPEVLAPYLEGDFTLAFDPLEGVRIADEQSPLFRPGKKLSYSNTNTVLLAMIVEAATGHTFRAELDARILEPLDLSHTSYPSDSDFDGPYIHGYLPGQPPLTDISPLSPTLLGAAGGIVSSAMDLANFYRALLRGDLLEPEELEAMQTIDPVATGGIPDSGLPGGGWGLGLLKQRFPCAKTAWGHDSEIPGYTTAAWSSKNGTRQVVIAVNSFFDPDSDAVAAIRDVLTAAFCGP